MRLCKAKAKGNMFIYNWKFLTVSIIFTSFQSLNSEVLEA